MAQGQAGGLARDPAGDSPALILKLHDELIAVARVEVPPGAVGQPQLALPGARPTVA